MWEKNININEIKEIRTLTTVFFGVGAIKKIEDIAKDCYLSEGHIHHIFKKELKTSPINYIKMKKLSIAQKLLSFGTVPTEVAQKLGFEDYSVFYRNYVKFFNRKPSDDFKK